MVNDHYPWLMYIMLIWLIFDDGDDGDDDDDDVIYIYINILIGG